MEQFYFSEHNMHVIHWPRKMSHVYKIYTLKMKEVFPTRPIEELWTTAVQV